MQTMTELPAKLIPVLRAFGRLPKGEWETLRGGHINETLHLRLRSECGMMEDKVLQRLNTHVFPDPVGVMENITLVTAHLRSKGAATLIYDAAQDGRNFCRDQDGGFWRLCDYVPSVSYTSGAGPSVVEGAGEAFGAFQQHLSDFPAEKLHDTIPHFHDTPARFANLRQTIAAHPAGAMAVQPELNWLQSIEAEACHLCELQAQGKLPLRVTHNDAKIANVLFAPDTGHPLMVIDLDTVMPGLVAYDFGDAVRTAACAVPEDEPDTARVRLDLSVYEAFARGFLRQIAGSLTVREMETLSLGCFAVTVEQAVRFLDDHLQGDHYYRVSYPGHNLVRARCQIALAKDMQKHRGEMQAIAAGQVVSIEKGHSTR